VATRARTDEVTRRYGDVVAVDGVTLAVHQGETVGLLGPNGAGESTLVNLLSGLRYGAVTLALAGTPCLFLGLAIG
jgi:ABC-2 type transport system ATP-binding protein